MPIPTDNLLGTKVDGSKDPDYCVYCLVDGEFKVDTMEEVIDFCVGFTDDFNRSAGTSYTPDEYRRLLWRFIPTLGRWRKD